MKQRYDSYKPSGIDWIGEIPSHWELLRMRFLCDMITGDKDTVNKVDDGEYPFYVRSPQIERINSYSFDGEAVLMAGDGVGAGKVVHYANGKFDFHQRVYNFHNFKGIKGILLYYYLKTLFKYKIEEGGAKNTVDSVRQPWLKDFPICVPPLAEQEVIAAWLDEKCGEIDAAISKVNRELELIDELKQSEISRVVTRGLNPDESLRPSGIDWIGDIPEHWEMVPLKSVVSYNDEVWSEMTDKDKNISYVEIGDVSQVNGVEKWTDYTFIDAPSRARRIARKDDVIISTVRTYLRAIARIKEDGLTVSTGFMVLRAKSIDSVFLSYAVLNDTFIQEVIAKSTGVSYPAINSTDVSNIKIPVPPLSEQKDIADYLDKKCAEIDGLKAKLVKKRETLKELRHTIISEVVTGKRKVI